MTEYVTLPGTEAHGKVNLARALRLDGNPPLYLPYSGPGNSIPAAGQALVSDGAGNFGPGTATPLLGSVTLASPAPSIGFAAIPAGYSAIRLVVTGASAAAAESDRWLVMVNGDAGLHYDTQMIYGSNATPVAAVKNAQSGWIFALAAPGDVPAASATAGTAGLLQIEIPNYAGTTFQKVGRWFSGYSDAATAVADQVANTALIAWRSTAAITSVSVTLVSTSNLVAGTTACLYAA